MKDLTLIPNAPILIESTRSIGYSFEAAVADIIDNSIGKNAKRVDVYFDSLNDPVLAVLDDACGMNKNELETAMCYGSRSSLDERDEQDLGRFGLGLKMASLSQCRQLTVISKKDGQINAARWDLDHINKVNGWILIEFELEEICDLPFFSEINNRESGTAVIWKNFDRLEKSTNNLEKTFDEKISQTRKHISLVFHRFLSEKGGVKIFFNNEEIAPLDPFLESSPATQKLKEQSIFIDDKEIKVKPFVLPYLSKLNAKDKKLIGDVTDLRQNQGFYVYRNKRLIIYGTWFRLIKSGELNKLARVRVDIPNSLDSIWDIDVKKSTASLPDKIKRNLVQIVENTVGKSERVFSYRGRKTNTNDGIIHNWNVISDRDSYRYEINRDTVLYKQLENSLDENQLRYLNSFITTVENSFPFQDVYYRMAKNNDVKPNAIEDEELYKTGLDILSSAKSLNMDIGLTIESLKVTDVFKDKPEIIRKLQEDFNYE